MVRIKENSVSCRISGTDRLLSAPPSAISPVFTRKAGHSGSHAHSSPRVNQLTLTCDSSLGVCRSAIKGTRSQQIQLDSSRADSAVRVRYAQPASPVSRRGVRFGKIVATFRRGRDTLLSLCSAVFQISGSIQPISRASLWSAIFYIRVLRAETRFEAG
jgi:hypothetical protein